ncbi:MAG: MopE-related protein [Phycisphaerales bacterium]
MMNTFCRHIGAAVALALSCTAVSHAGGSIDLRLVPPAAPVILGQTFDVKMRAQRTATPTGAESFIAIDSIIKWNPQHLKLMGLTSTGSVPLLSSYFPSPAEDYTGINEASLPADGNALYAALGQLGSPTEIPAAGVQIVTFRFRVETLFTTTQVEILPELTVLYTGETVVYDGTVPGLDVFGQGINATIEQIDCSTIFWYRDADADGYGNPLVSQTGCAQPSGYVSDNTDCDDTTNTVRPGATERCADLAIDNDCDGSTAESEAVDRSTFYSDNDGDGFGAGAAQLFCALSTGYSVNSTDCDDSSAAVYPGAPELCATEGTDNDCDGNATEASDPSPFYRDQDGDGAGDPAQTAVACTAPAGFVANSNDQCPSDGTKAAPGACGCGNPDTDADGDLNPDCFGSIASLALASDRSAYRPGDTMRVRVAMSAAGTPIRGAALAIVFDATRLSFAAAAPVAGSPFTVESTEIADNAAGTLRYSVAAPVQSAGTTAPCAVADLDFIVLPGASECAASALVGFGVVGGASTVLPTETTVPMTPSVAPLGAVALDGTAPVLAGLPASASLAADAGTTLGAYLAQPTVAALDDCDGTVVVSIAVAYPGGAVDSAWPADGYFPVGQSTIDFSASDAAGNVVSAQRTVTVAAHQLLDLDITLLGVVVGDSTRSIRVRAGGSVQTVVVPCVRESGAASMIEVPVAAAYSCILVKDVAHSLTRSVAATVSNSRYQAEAALVQGDSNDDDFIDVLDFGAFVGDIGLDATRSARSNFNADLAVNTGDFAFIGIGFLAAGDSCGGLVEGTPRERVSVRELRRRGLGELVRADIDGDGWLDGRDIALFLQQ